MAPPLLILALSITGCLPWRHGAYDLPSDCAGRPSKHQGFSAERWPELAGQFRLVTVLTSYGGSPDVSRGRLTLDVADSAMRYAPRSPLRPSGPRHDRPLAGRSTTTDTHDPPVNVEYEGGRLYLGCRDCLDGSPDVYVVEWISNNSFGGTWRNYQTGIAHAIGPHGQWLTDPAGHFCATRISGAKD